MFKRAFVAVGALLCAAVNSGCVTDPLLPGSLGGGATAGQGAVIVGTVSASGSTGKALAWQGATECPEVNVALNGNPADIIFDDDCSFLVENVAPADLVELKVEIPSLGIAGSVQLLTVTDAELIEIEVAVGVDSLTISVERRATPQPGPALPSVIDDNNVTIQLPAGIYTQSLTVNGNNFALVGAAGKDCSSTDGWTVIDGTVLVKGNNATFRNVMFLGTVEVRANNTKFINCCFDGSLVTFGKGHGHGGDKGDDEDDDDQGEDDDD